MTGLHDTSISTGVEKVSVPTESITAKLVDAFSHAEKFIQVAFFMRLFLSHARNCV